MSLALLLTAEIIAQVYYAAVRDATPSPILRALCDRILADEAAHVRFQSERLAMLRAGRGRVAVTLAVAAQRTLFAATALIVWNGHRPALERGGFFFRLLEGVLGTIRRRRGTDASAQRGRRGTGDGGRATGDGRQQRGASSRAARPAVIPSAARDPHRPRPMGWSLYWDDGDSSLRSE